MLENLGLGFTGLCLLWAVLSGARAVFFNVKLQTYLKAHHYDKWKEFVGEGVDLFRNVFLKPMNSDKSYFFFLFRSTEDFGDKQVRDYMRHVRAGILGFVISVVAALVSFSTIGL